MIPFDPEYEQLLGGCLPELKAFLPQYLDELSEFDKQKRNEMGRGKHRTYPDENTGKEKELRQKIKQQEAEIKRLKSELKTLNKAFEKTAQYIKGNVDNVSVEKIIQAAKQEKPMVEIKKEQACPDCGAETKHSKLPFGRLEICSAACGWRKVENET